jgi:hypothetical protein
MKHNYLLIRSLLLVAGALAAASPLQAQITVKNQI